MDDDSCAHPGAQPPLEAALLDSSEWARLDHAAYRVSIKRSVRFQAWFEAGAGILAAACGIAAPFPPLTVVGLALSCGGFWNLFRPSITGLLVDGVLVILAGIFNCVAWLWMEHAHATSAGKWIVTGVLQIVWGVRRILAYPAARRAVNDPPAIAELERILHDLSKRDAKTDPTVVEFRTGRFHERRNRLGLYAEGAVGMLEQQAVRLEKRSEIWVEARGSTWHGRSIEVTVQMSDLQLIGRMPAAHFERFEHWKLGSSPARSIAA